MRVARPDGTIVQVGEMRIARADSTVAKIGELRIAGPDGSVAQVYTSTLPLALLSVVDIGTAGTQAITVPAGAGFAFAVIVGGGGGGSATNAGEAGSWTSGIIPVSTSTATIGAGGAASNNFGGNAAGGSTSLAGLTASGGAAGQQGPGGSPVSTRTVTLPWEETAMTNGENNFTIGPGGTYQQSGQRGGGSGSVGFTGGSGIKGGDGWVRIWFWTRDPRTP